MKFNSTFVNPSQISGFIEPTTTGTDKGKSFKRQSKGTKAREERKYVQLKSGTVIHVKVSEEGLQRLS